MTESNNKNILIEGKKVVKDENLNKADNIAMNNIKKENEEDKNIKDTTKKRGRKNKGSNIKGKHTKKDEDNLMNKIKRNFLNTFIRKLIMINLINKGTEIKKLPKSFMEDVSKEKNEPLFKMKISEILCEQEISTKYSTFGKYENKITVEKILKEKKETNVIKILNLTFEEAFILYRNEPKDKEKLEEMKYIIEGLKLLDEDNNYIGFQKFKKELKKKHEDEYIEKVEIACLRYKKYFEEKKL